MKVKLTHDQKIPIYSPRDVFEVMREILMKDDKFDRDKEHFWVIGLMSNNVIAYVELITLGLLNQTIVAPREVYRVAVLKGVARAILCHNHPSGNIFPSAEDIDVIKLLVQAGLIVGITVEDHVIITTQKYLSLREHGLWQDIVEDAKYKPKYVIEQESERRKAKEIAREMKSDGIETSRIAKMTGLTEEEIEKL